MIEILFIIGFIVLIAMVIFDKGSDDRGGSF